MIMDEWKVEALPEDEAKYHLKRCEDSGLWVPSSEARPGGSRSWLSTLPRLRQLEAPRAADNVPPALPKGQSRTTG
eukprot:Skav235997  [mRNA]  locus=scaffold348:351285:354216:+ [translate_table: standard]